MRDKPFRVLDAKYPNKNLDLDQGQKKLDQDIPTHWYQYVSTTEKSR